MDDGYTKVPNKLLDAMAQYKFTQRQYTVLIFVIRNTYGWGKPYGDTISLSRLSRVTGIARHHVSAAVSDLEKIGVLNVERRNGAVSTIGINNPENWDKPVTDLGTCTATGTCPPTGTGGVPKRVTGTCTQKSNTSKKYKETISKKENRPLSAGEEHAMRVRALHPELSIEELIKRRLL